MKQFHWTWEFLTKVVGLDREQIISFCLCRMMMKHLNIWNKEIGIAPETNLHVSAKKITSGSMVQVLVVHVQKFIMTVVKNTAVVNRAVQ